VMISEARGWEWSTVRSSVKPFELDTLFWRIVGLTDNEKAPLSLRANGAFSCRGLPILDERVDDADVQPTESAKQLLALANKTADAALLKFGSMPFSDLLEEYATSTGTLAGVSFGPTYITALILDRRILDARRAITDHKEGVVKSRSNFSTRAAGPQDHRDFYDLALEYVNAT